MSQQLAQCIQITEHGKKEVYIMKLEGKEFTLSSSKYFKATMGKYYFPRIYVCPNKKTRVHWYEVNN